MYSLITTRAGTSGNSINSKVAARRMARTIEFDACQAPAGRKLLIDQRVDLTLSLYHSAQHLGKVFLIGIGHAVAIGAAA